MHPLLQQKGNFPCKIYPDSDGQWIAQEFSSLDGSIFPLPHCKDEINAGFPCGPALKISNWFSSTARQAASSDLHSAAEDLLGKVFWGVNYCLPSQGVIGGDAPSPCGDLWDPLQVLAESIWLLLKRRGRMRPKQLHCASSC